MAKRGRGPAPEGGSWAAWMQKVLKPDDVPELIEQAHREAELMKARNYQRSLEVATLLGLRLTEYEYKEMPR